MIFGIIKILIFGSIMASTAFGFEVADTYTELKKEDENVLLTQAIKMEFIEVKEAIYKIARIEKTARSDIQKVKMTEIQKALRMYYLDNKRYPIYIDKLIGKYIAEDANIIRHKDFNYSSLGLDNYTLEMTLDNGETYKVSKLGY